MEKISTVQKIVPIAGLVKLFANKTISYNFFNLLKEVLQPTVAASQIFYFAIRATTTANNATPSIRAAEIIIAN
jgi:hypothetical protein